MTRRQQAYERRIKDLIERFGKLADGEVKNVLAILENARREIAARVASTPWEAQHIPELKAAVETAIDGFRQQYLTDQADALTNVWNAGIDMVDAPLAAAGIRAAAPELSRASLEILQGYSTDLIEGLAAEAAKNVKNAVTMGVMGQKTLHEVMKDVSLALDDKGILGKVSRRAETITRTEMGHVNSWAREARMQAVAAAGTDPAVRWRKKWIDSGKAHPRMDHLALDGVTVDLDEDFPGGIPYPHAPGLPASQSINCGCTHILVTDDWDQLTRSFDSHNYAERANYRHAA